MMGRARPERSGLAYESLSNRAATADRLEMQAAGERLDAYLSALAAAPDDRVLEVGCGSGALARAIAASCGARVTGIDADPGKIAFCRRTARRGGLDMTFACGDVTTLAAAWRDAFSLVFCRYFLMYALPDASCAAMLRTLAGMVSPGGRLVAFEADIDFAHRFFPPLPPFAVSAFDTVVDHYRDHGLIDWRRGTSLGHVFELAGLGEPEIRIADARVILNGKPADLVTHDGLDIEPLLRPALAECGRLGELPAVAECYRTALGRPGGFCYTPVFQATWQRPVGRPTGLREVIENA